MTAPISDEVCKACGEPTVVHLFSADLWRCESCGATDEEAQEYYDIKQTEAHHLRQMHEGTF